ncbi:cytochrome P450 [Pseudomonas aeruginosa]|nr:cytochrome P450 [Pseudomonas aeruginosa]
MASHQSTGVTLTWSLLLLAQRPELLQAATRRAGAVMAGDPLGLDLRDCALLRAVLQECLRLYPPAYGLAPRQVTADIEVFGQRLKRGDVTMVSAGSPSAIPLVRGAAGVPSRALPRTGALAAPAPTSPSASATAPAPAPRWR